MDHELENPRHNVVSVQVMGSLHPDELDARLAERDWGSPQVAQCEILPKFD